MMILSIYLLIGLGVLFCLFTLSPQSLKDEAVEKLAEINDAGGPVMVMFALALVLVLWAPIMFSDLGKSE